MERYVSAFLIEGFSSLGLVASMSPADLRYLGVAAAHATKVLLPAVRKLRRPQAIAYERAKNAAMLAYDEGAATLIRSKFGHVHNPVLPTLEDRKQDSFEYDFVWENERFLSDGRGWGRHYPKRSHLLRTDPPRWMDASSGAPAHASPGDILAQAPDGWHWVGPWNVVQPQCPKTGEPSGDRSGWCYGTSFASMRLTGGVWIAPKPFTVVRQRLWRRARRRRRRFASHTENATETAVVATKNPIEPIANEIVASPDVARLERIVLDVAREQASLRQIVMKSVALNESLNTSHETVRTALAARDRAERVAEDATKRVKRNMSEARDAFERKRVALTDELATVRERLNRDASDARQRAKILEQELERSQAARREMQRKIANAEAALTRAERNATEHAAKVNRAAENARIEHRRQIEACRLEIRQEARERESHIREETERRVLDMERAFARERAEERARAEEKGTEEISTARNQLLGEIDRVRKDAQRMLAESLRNSVAEVIRERALRRQAEEAFASANCRCVELTERAEKADRQRRVVKEELKIVANELRRYVGRDEEAK